MDTFVYMHTYSEALESVNALTTDDDEALESFKGKAKKLNKSYQKEMNELYAQLNAAYRAEQYDDALARADDIEKLIREWKAELKDLPPDSKFSIGVRVTASILVTIFGIMAFIKTPSIAVSLGKLCKKLGMSQAVIGSKTGMHAITTAAGAISGAGIGVTYGMLMQYLMPKSMVSQLVKTNPTVAQYKEDPNGKNSSYIIMQNSLDESLKVLDTVKDEIRRASKEGQS
jgi:hypothetical protein